jgi:hypothetical protein
LNLDFDADQDPTSDLDGDPDSAFSKMMQIHADLDTDATPYVAWNRKVS